MLSSSHGLADEIEVRLQAFVLSPQFGGALRQIAQVLECVAAFRHRSRLTPPARDVRRSGAGVRSERRLSCEHLMLVASNEASTGDFAGARS